VEAASKRWTQPLEASLSSLFAGQQEALKAVLESRAEVASRAAEKEEDGRVEALRRRVEAAGRRLQSAAARAKALERRAQLVAARRGEVEGILRRNDRGGEEGLLQRLQEERPLVKAKRRVATIDGDVKEDAASSAPVGRGG